MGEAEKLCLTAFLFGCEEGMVVGFLASSGDNEKQGQLQFWIKMSFVLSVL